jgi:hypothetical protein
MHDYIMFYLNYLHNIQYTYQNSKTLKTPKCYTPDNIINYVKIATKIINYKKIDDKSSTT